MLLDIFRRRVVASRVGFTLFGALVYTSVFSLHSGFRPRTLIINAGAGLLLGFLAAQRLHKNGKYFVKNIAEGKFQTTLKYKDMFKKGEIPHTKLERAEYLEYLNAVEYMKSKESSPLKNVLALAFLFAVLVLILLVLGPSILSILFALVIAYAGYGFIKSRADLKKIARLKNEITATK